MAEKIAFVDRDGTLIWEPLAQADGVRVDTMKILRQTD